MDLADNVFVEAARVLDDDEPPALVDNSTLPKAGETPTSTQREAELAATVDGGKGFCALTVSPAGGYMSFLLMNFACTPELPPLIFFSR